MEPSCGRDLTALSSEVVPEAVREVVLVVCADGPPHQSGISWPRSRWIENFPDLGVHFRALPDKLDRTAVREICRQADSDPEAARRSFVTVMAWGYATVGYGVARTKYILSLPDAQDRLLRAVRTLGTRGGLAGYEALATSSRLHRLGPAFGTKFLYFCPQAMGAPSALILDRLVCKWLRENTDLRLRSVSCGRRPTSCIWISIHGWATELFVVPDVIEQSVFIKQASELGGQWGM